MRACGAAGSRRSKPYTNGGRGAVHGARSERRNHTGVGRHIQPSGGLADWFLEKRSKPPFRSAGNHQQNVNALKFLKPVFGEIALSEITAESVENYLGERLQSGRRIHTKLGLQLRGRIKPATAHQEFRILSHILNVAVKQKRLAVNPCLAAAFPVSVKKSTRKPHYMTATEQAKIEVAAPGYLRNIVVISPRPGTAKPHMTNLRKIWAGTLKRAGVPVFYSLRTSAHVRYQAE